MCSHHQHQHQSHAHRPNWARHRLSHALECISAVWSPQHVITTLVPFLFILILHFSTFTHAAKPPFHYSSIAENRMIMQDRAILHVNLMNTLGLCRDPRPQVIYPAATAHKIYYPRGTLVHRCADQTGCCPNPGEACRPETVEQIEKVFFVNTFALSAARGHRTRLKAPTRNFTTSTETLTFTNHTSCKCIKLAPDAIEHDEMQSVVSRPLVKPIQSLTSNSWFYHVIGGLSAVAILMIMFFIYKWMYINRPLRRP